MAQNINVLLIYNVLYCCIVQRGFRLYYACNCAWWHFINPCFQVVDLAQLHLTDLCMWTGSCSSLLQCTDPNLGDSTIWPYRPKSTLTNSPSNLDSKSWNINRSESTTHTDCMIFTLCMHYSQHPILTLIAGSRTAAIVHVYLLYHLEWRMAKNLLYHPLLHWSRHKLHAEEC